MDFAIVDLQGFKDNENNFIVKEFALFTKNIQFHDIIKSSSSCAFETLNYSSKQSVEWLKNFYHGLDWNDGYITVDELRKTVAPILKNKLIYVKGLEKIEWLHQLMDNESSSKTKLLIVNAEDLGCDLNFNTRRNKKKNMDNMNDYAAGQQQQSTTSVTCSKHRKMNQKKICCALQNAINLKLWYLNKEQTMILFSL